MNVKYLVVAAWVFILATCEIYAQVTTGELSGKDRVNSITTAVPFLLIAPDSRSGAMGDVGVASKPDVNSIHWNPSKLAFTDRPYSLGISYTPWLQSLVPDINLGYLTGYYKIDDRQTVAGSLRFFSLGEIQYTDAAGNPNGSDIPNEMAVDGAYALKLSETFSIGSALRFIRSSLAAGQVTNGQEIRPGTSVAADISAYYQKPVEISGYKIQFAGGANVSNIGSKMAYTTETAERDFIPTNLRVGGAGKIQIDEYNELALMLDVNKLLVPTNPLYAHDDSGNVYIAKGKDPNRSVPAGIFGSFNDAPEGFSEELNEISYSAGVEYWYDQQFALRGGYFYEHPLKGNRQFFTVGVGLKYNIFGLDFAYLVPTDQRNPLQNTLRFSLKFDFNNAKKQS